MLTLKNDKIKKPNSILPQLQCWASFGTPEACFFGASRYGTTKKQSWGKKERHNQSRAEQPRRPLGGVAAFGGHGLDLGHEATRIAVVVAGF